VFGSDLTAAAAYLVVDYATYTLTVAGEVDAAAEGYERMLALARSRGDRLSVNDLVVLRAFLHAQRGDLQLAEADLSAIESGPSTVVMATYASGFLADVPVDRGKAVEAGEAIGRASAEEIPLGHRLLFLHGKARARLAAGAVEEAVEEFQALGRHMESLGVRNPAFAPWRSQAALALHRLGRDGDARELATEELELAKRWGAPRTVGVALHALGLVEGGHAGEQLMREAVEVLSWSPARLEHARALVDLGAALRRANDRSEARARLREGIELALRCGATPLVEHANQELAATGARRRTILLSGLDALTASERRVAQLAAEGLSNRKVSFSEKFPSSKTSRNSQPSCSPWIECGIPAGKFQRSPSPTSAMKLRSSWSIAVMRARPASVNAHSASLCQCSSRIPPAFRRMFTPASCVATGSSRTVTSRAQPPVRRRLRAAANENLRFGIVPESVGLGLRELHTREHDRRRRR
jgi:tetratricopeptide (TPR) repeat protein